MLSKQCADLSAWISRSSSCSVGKLDEFNAEFMYIHPKKCNTEEITSKITPEISYKHEVKHVNHAIKPQVRRNK